MAKFQSLLGSHKSSLMKKTILIVAAMLFVSGGLLAQKKNDIKTDLFSPILRTGTFKYERAFTDDISAQLAFFYTGFHAGETALFSGFGITPEFRFYLSATPAPNGTYLAPNVRYFKFTLTDSEVEGEGGLSNISIAFNLGKQVLLKNIAVIDAWVGPSYNFRTFEAVSPDSDVGYQFLEANGFGIRLGLAVGLAF